MKHIIFTIGLFLSGMLYSQAYADQATTDKEEILNMLEKNQKELIDKIYATCNSSKKIDKVENMQKKCESEIGDKIILGEAEFVTVKELGVSFNARIDTGAESSSIDAQNIVLFERDGENWVKFDLMFNEKVITKESKVIRTTKVKQASSPEPISRPVISVHLKIGEQEVKTELNLTDRSKLVYPLLIGRKFIKDLAVVDVSKSYVHGQPKK